MDALEAIFTRRSIRKYTPEPVSEEDLKTLLAAAMSAPSAGNQQPWEFIVIDDRKILDAIPQVHPYSKMLLEASLAILVCGNLEIERHRGYWIQDCSAATQNILLAARALGLGTVWLGVTPNEARVSGIGQLLKLPKSIVPFSLIAVGHPAEEKGRADRFKPERIHRNGWQASAA
jgi:nitroreductase